MMAIEEASDIALSDPAHGGDLECKAIFTRAELIL